jgi:hypothetical protein
MMSGLQVHAPRQVREAQVRAASDETRQPHHDGNPIRSKSCLYRTSERNVSFAGQAVR